MRLAALAGLLVAGAAMPALAVPAQYDIDFVSAFADACVPQRLSYTGTQDTALAEGWTKVERTAHAELDTMLAESERMLSQPEVQGKLEYAVYSKPIDGIDHYLLVTRSSGDVGAPGKTVYISCYLYNLDATASIDPEPVTALLGGPILHTQEDGAAIAHMWGPPCLMPGTGETYLSYLPEGSAHAEAARFSGLGIRLATTEPVPGEAVPSTSC